jgi:hypothetical protein
MQRNSDVRLVTFRNKMARLICYEQTMRRSRPDIDAGVLVAMVANGTAGTRENFGIKEWRRKPA